MAEARIVPVYGKGNPFRCVARLAKRLRACFGFLRDRYYRRKLVGMEGTLANGVRWRFAVPEIRRGGFSKMNRTHLQLIFDDPCVVGIIVSGRQAWRSQPDIQSFYEQGCISFAESLARRGYELADSDDPDGFFVRSVRRCA